MKQNLFARYRAAREIMRYLLSLMFIWEPIAMWHRYEWQFNTSGDLAFPALIFGFAVCSAHTVVTFNAKWTERGNATDTKLTTVWLGMGALALFGITLHFFSPTGIILTTKDMGIMLGLIVVNLFMVFFFEIPLRKIEEKPNHSWYGVFALLLMVWNLYVFITLCIVTAAGYIHPWIVISFIVAAATSLFAGNVFVRRSYSNHKQWTFMTESLLLLAMLIAQVIISVKLTNTEIVPMWWIVLNIVTVTAALVSNGLTFQTQGISNPKLQA